MLVQVDGGFCSAIVLLFWPESPCTLCLVLCLGGNWARRTDPLRRSGDIGVPHLFLLPWRCRSDGALVLNVADILVRCRTTSP